MVALKEFMQRDGNFKLLKCFQHKKNFLVLKLRRLTANENCNYSFILEKKLEILFLIDVKLARAKLGLIT